MAEDLDSLKCIISALLVAHRGRMTISEFTRVYKSEEGHPVPFENFGCTNIRQFLNKISDTVTLTRGSTGEDVIQAKVKQELKHIDQMVKQQKPSSTKPKFKHAMHRPPVRGKYVPRARGGGRSFGGRDRTTTAMAPQKSYEPPVSQATPPSIPNSNNRTSPTSVTSTGTAQRRGVSRLHYSLLQNSSSFNSNSSGSPIHTDTGHHSQADSPIHSTHFVKQEPVLMESPSASQSETSLEVSNTAQRAHYSGEPVGQLSGSNSVSVKEGQYDMPYNSLVQQWTAHQHVTSSMFQPVCTQTLPVQGTSAPPGQPILRPSLCCPFITSPQKEDVACNGEPNEEAVCSALNPGAVAYEPRPTGAQASTGRDELELARGAVSREFAHNQTQVAPEVANKGTSTGDLTVGIPKGFATCLRSILDEYPAGLDIEVLMEMCEERIGSSAYFKQNKHPLEMLPDILSSVSSACIMPDSGGMFRVMLPQKEKQNNVPALPDDLRCGLLSILLKAPEGLEASELLDVYESRFGEHHHIKAHGQRTSDFIRNILYALPFTAVKNCGDGGHIVQMLEEGFQHPMQSVGQSTPQITADEFNAYPLQELPHCWTFSVAIGEVFSPSEFYVLITADGALTQLTELMTELDEFYNSASSDFYSVTIGDLKPGFVCAALYTNDGQPLWHRAVVKSVQAREVFVFYIDYGTVMPVKVADIRRLRSDFLEFPAQAIKASLSGVKPKNEQAWTPKAKERFLQLVRMGECSCSVVSKEEDICFVELLMSDGSMEYSLSEVLIYEEFAVSTIVTEAVAPGTSIETWTFSDGYTADIIVWNGERYMSSMGISKVFGWKDDLVSKKLSEKGIRVDGALLEKKCVPELHLEVCLSDNVFYFDSIQLYHLQSVPYILRILQHPSDNLRSELESKVASFNTLSDQAVFMDEADNCDKWCSSYDDDSSLNRSNDASRSQDTAHSSALMPQSQTDDVTDSGSSQDAFRQNLETKLAELKQKRASLRMAVYENPDSDAASELEFIESKVDSFTKVLNELDINSGRKVVTEPSKLSASSSSKHPNNTAGSSKSVVDKFQSKLLEALMTSKQK
uniref:Tudor domain-containing protein 5 n=1 Tax=Rhipicephalus zambeziensis TaxID=60191 RepID=A0A224Z4I3_9ACAR